MCMMQARTCALAPAPRAASVPILVMLRCGDFLTLTPCGRLLCRTAGLLRVTPLLLSFWATLLRLEPAAARGEETGVTVAPAG